MLLVPKEAYNSSRLMNIGDSSKSRNNTSVNECTFVDEFTVFFCEQKPYTLVGTTVTRPVQDP